MHAPSAQHIFGTDELGRDIFSRIVWGSRFSLSIGVLAVLLGTAIGMVFGAIAGYFGGVVDDIIMRLMDILQSIPGILLAITISVVLGPGFFNTLLALSIGGIPMACRLTAGFDPGYPAPGIFGSSNLHQCQYNPNYSQACASEQLCSLAGFVNHEHRQRDHDGSHAQFYRPGCTASHP